MRLAMTAMIAIVLFAAAPLTAQPPEIKPGPEHAFLKEAVGVWDATAKTKGNESKGELFCKMAPGGLWMLENFKSEIAGKPFEGYGATTYDPAKKKFTNVWIDSMVPTPMLSEGTYDADKKVLTLHGNMPLPDGKSMKSTITITYTDTNNKTLALKVSTPDGKDAGIVEITYKRRVK
jgi:Protein of unknown function (DUF1579)